MKTQVLPITPESVALAARLLQQGELVALPTETVYGIAADARNGEAVKKIFEAKGRPQDNPLIVHICGMEMLNGIVSEVPERAKKLAAAFWPGPLTMIFKKKDIVPAKATGGLDTVAVRFPNHPVARAIIRAAGLPIAAPSANSSGKPSPTRASHVEYDLNGKIDMIVDGGAAEWGLESTIVDVSDEIPMILRPGAVTKEMIEEVVGQVEIDPAILHKPTADFKPKAPGMKYTHYSPKAEVFLVKGEQKAVAERINALAAAERAAGKKRKQRRYIMRISFFLWAAEQNPKKSARTFSKPCGNLIFWGWMWFIPRSFPKKAREWRL